MRKAKFQNGENLVGHQSTKKLGIPLIQRMFGGLLLCFISESSDVFGAVSSLFIIKIRISRWWNEAIEAWYITVSSGFEFPQVAATTWSKSARNKMMPLTIIPITTVANWSPLMSPMLFYRRTSVSVQLIACYDINISRHHTRHIALLSSRDAILQICVSTISWH